MPFDTQMQFVILMNMAVAIIVATTARRKGRSFLLWLIYAMVISPVALIHVLILPYKTENGAVISFETPQMPNEFVISKRRINYCFIGCPMDTLSYVITSNLALKRITVKLNLFSEKPIKSFDITLEMLDGMNGRIAEKTFTGMKYSDSVEFDISEFPYTMYVNFTIEHIAFEDGEEWIKQGERLEYNVDIMDGYELEKLKALTNKYAVCLPYETDDYWVCSCSKANNSDKCVLCGITKEELFKKVDRNTVVSLRNDLIRRNNLSRFNLHLAEQNMQRQGQAEV
ncbi:MAG: hypothetical protein IJR47_03435 [Clostridia bacterium]|nr:hypothetical protein [Clostridia bacterium]